MVQIGSLALCLPALLDLHVQLLSQVISLGSQYLNFLILFLHFDYLLGDRPLEFTNSRFQS